LNVSQTWSSAEYATDPILETAVGDEKPYRDDRRVITSMEWVDIGDQGDQSSVCHAFVLLWVPFTNFSVVYSCAL
jgi:hypothetical protein